MPLAGAVIATAGALLVLVVVVVVAVVVLLVVVLLLLVVLLPTLMLMGVDLVVTPALSVASAYIAYVPAGMLCQLAV